MNLEELLQLDNCRVLNKGKIERGNLLLLMDEDSSPKILKIYRIRQSVQTQWMSGISHRFLERKRGVSPEVRYETELLTLNLWESHGFDVFKRLDLPLPTGVEPPALWFEYVPGRPLGKILYDPKVETDIKLSLMARLSKTLCHRHCLAIELSDPLLIKEHASIRHVFIHEDRIIHFDFEGGFLPYISIMEALAQEMAGYVRSIIKCQGIVIDDFIQALVENYEDRHLLREIAEWGVEHPGPYRRVRRWYDQRRATHLSKTAGLKKLLKALS